MGQEHTLLIGLAGKAGSGKTTLANLIQQRLKMRRVSLSWELKVMVETVFGVPVTTDKRAPVLGGKMTYRTLLQQVGVAMRGIHEDVWVDEVDRIIHNTPSPAGYVIDDVRFENEARYVLENGGRLFLLMGRHGYVSETEGLHVSEAVPALVAEHAILVSNYKDGPEMLWRTFEEANAE